MKTYPQVLLRTIPVFLISLFTFFFSPYQGLYGQTNSGFNFQAVARDGAGNLIKEKDLTVIIGIRSGSEDGELVWQETQVVGTNAFGLFSLIVCGNAELKTGGSSPAPADIDWSRAEHFIDLAVDDGNGIVGLGVKPLQSVPYALASRGVSQSLSTLSVGGDGSPPPEEALFMVRRNDGYPVFAVFEDGVWAYTDTVDTPKGVKGGFAVGGYQKSSKGLNGNEFLRVTPDSVRIYTNQETSKGVKGGFAVGGYSKSAKGSPVNYMDLTPENYFIGHEAGLNNTTGLYNSFLGYQAGKFNTKGNENIFIGYMAGFSNIGLDPAGGVPQLGRYNCYIGYQAGYSSKYGDSNTMIGHNAGWHNIASRNTFIGSGAGYTNTEGSYNTFLGLSAGGNNLTGSDNIFVGHQAGFSNFEGDNNVSIGTVAGAGIKSGVNNVIIGSGAVAGSVYAENGNGSFNVILGFEAGQFARNGSGNVFIGNQAGKTEEGSNLLYIANSETIQPLVWGSFESKNLVINGNAADNPNKNTLYVNGVAGGSLAWSTDSDARMKKDVEPITGALGKVMALQGVNFSWDNPEREGMGRQMGFIAQQAAPVVPEVVQTGGSRYTMQYAPLTALLVEAVKEQQQIIEQKEAEMQILKERIERLEKFVGFGD